MVRKKVRLALIIIILLLSACGSDESASAETAPAYEPGSDDAFAEYDADTADIVAGDGQFAQGEQPFVQEQLIIRDARLEIIVEDTGEALKQIASLVGEEGWVVRSTVTQYDQGQSGTIVIRVPSERFDETLERIQDLALDVRAVTTESEDVTDEYIDVTARLENLRVTADRVRALLAEADTVEEALSVNAELSRLEGDIESLEGRRQYLSQSARFSSITVNVTPDALSQPLEIGGWQPGGVARDALATLINALQWLVSLVIWLAIFALPLLLLLLLPVALLFYLIRRRRRRRAATPEESA